MLLVDEIADLLRPSWGSEQWILEGWNQINLEEKALIKHRMDELFKDGLPFELKHNKLLYVYTFSLLAQLEVLAIQVPLKFSERMETTEFKERMREQLLDEIFHGLVFTKIVYLLAAPHALPPEYSKNIEVLCNFIRHEECPKISIMLLNLIGEGWIEELFKSLGKYHIAPKVFETIINDEHRHVCEADLYRDIGLPNMTLVGEKLAYLEEQLLTNLFLQYNYVLSVTTLLGVEGTADFIQSLNDKHQHQLAKINLQPSDKWYFFMQMMHEMLPKLDHYAQGQKDIAMTPIRQVFMTQWDNPSDPTMVGEFEINITCLDFFNKKYPPETVTTLMLQAISLALSKQDSFRTYLSHSKLYQSKESYVGIVVKLPECGDHIGTIVFENCHLMSIQELSGRLRTVLQMMAFCYKKRETLEQSHPELKQLGVDLMFDFANDVYGYPIPGSPVISLSNIGYCGYTRAKSPLRSTEAMKFTLLSVEKKMVWNKTEQAFEAHDLLPVSISADHRLFDGNLPIPKLIDEMFQQVFQQMLLDANEKTKAGKTALDQHFIKVVDQVLMNNLELGYKALVVLQTVWPEFMRLEELFNQFKPELMKAMSLDSVIA